LFETLSSIDPKSGKIGSIMTRGEKSNGMFFFSAFFTIAILCEVTTDLITMAEISDNIEENILLNISK